ncbi:MAG: hypothetical protein AB8G05_22985 [Oligoflexales bacterium]
MSEHSEDFLHNDRDSEIADMVMSISFAYTEIKIFEAVNRDFEIIWKTWHKRVYKKLKDRGYFPEVKAFDPSKTRVNLRVKDGDEISSNVYLRRALQIMNNLVEEDA